MTRGPTTIHPCQFPVELAERLILSLTRKGDLVVDPYMGVGSTAVAAVRHGRLAAGADTEEQYLEIARSRVILAAKGLLPTRPMGKLVYEPPPGTSLTTNPFTNGNAPQVKQALGASLEAH